MSGVPPIAPVRLGNAPVSR